MLFYSQLQSFCNLEETASKISRIRQGAFLDILYYRLKAHLPQPRKETPEALINCRDSQINFLQGTKSQ